MSNSKGQTSFRGLMNNGKNSLLPPKIPFPTIPPSYTEYIPASALSHGAFLKGKDDNPRHNRASSESFTMEEQPSWLDELLDEPETPVRRGGHRRSSSDSFAYVEAANLGLGNMNANYVAHEDSRFKNVPSLPSWGSSQDFDLFGHGNAFKMDVNYSGNKTKKGQWNSSVGSGVPHRSVPSPRVNTVAEEKILSNEKHDGVELGISEDEKKESSHAKPFEVETKRAKQQFAQRSRVRKLQYIAELERNVQALQADGTEISAEIEFLNQRNLILSMENKALRQRLESLSQEQRIKYFEQEVLEREVQRLKSICMQQQQQQQKTQVPSSHRRSNSKDLDQQFANLSLKQQHKEANADLKSISGQLHI